MLKFDESTHTFTLDGVVIPSVTQILKKAGLIDDAWYDMYYANKGTAIHKAVELFENDDLDEDSLDDEIKPYLGAWIKFKLETDWRTAQTELQVHGIGYAGIVDLVGSLNEEPAIIDLKSGSVVSPWWGLQLAAYVNAIEIEVDLLPQRYALQLKNDGTYKLHEYKDRNDIRVFNAALTIANWKEGK